tara:strand:- start:17826 stop:19229 length:1404 start_codon:yes stop_codon:yes gene_type:complete
MENKQNQSVQQNQSMSNSAVAENWSPASWRGFTAWQQPSYQDTAALESVTSQLANEPGLVATGEIDRLKKELAAVAKGKAFLLQGGDCAESFAAHSESAIEKSLRVLMQMAVVLTYGGRMPVVKIARIAGQYAKPRSSDFEKKGDVSLPSYRGDIINGVGFTDEDRIPDPARMMTAYQQSVTTLNTMRSLLQGGLANLQEIHQLNLDFAHKYSTTDRFLEMASQIEHSLQFMEACGIAIDSPYLSETRVYTSHEALLLPYEQAFIRQCPETGKWYNRSAHFIWIGDRTRQLDGAHIEMLRGLENPIGLKVGPSMQPDELVTVCQKLNPNNEAGKLTLIARFGAKKINDHLAILVEAVQQAGLNVIWSCDPMHGNTVTAEQGLKTRRYEDIFQEIESFFDIHQKLKSFPGGIHLELTGADVTECTGGAIGLNEADLEARYHTQCDPRLNVDQSIEIAFALSDYLVAGR